VLLLEVGDARVTALRCVDGKCQELASVASAGGTTPTAARPAGEHDLRGLAGVIDPEITPVVIRVCPRQVLNRTVSLPLAAAETGVDFRSLCLELCALAITRQGEPT
jgi:hypothetical protein